MTRATSAGAAILLSAAAIALLACGPRPPESEPQESGAPQVLEYRVRGVLERLPAAAAGTVRIRHEAIPELVGPSGEIEGMPAMTMDFPLAAELDLSGLAAGSPVRVVLVVDWDDARPVQVAAIEPLPADTELELD